MPNIFDDLPDSIDDPKKKKAELDAGKNVFDQVPADMPEREATLEASADKPLEWKDVPGKAIDNFPQSAANVGSAIIAPVLHPIQTAQNIAGLIKGGASKLTGLIPQGADRAIEAISPTAGAALKGARQYLPQDAESKDANEGNINAFGKYMGRYTTEEGWKHALAEDPAGVLLDASGLLTGGGDVAATLPGRLGAFGEQAATVGRAVDPIRQTGRAVGATTRFAAEHVPAFLTGSSPREFSEAIDAGINGGEQGTAFRQHMRDQPNAPDIVDMGRDAVAQDRTNRGEAYNLDMDSHVRQDNTKLDLTPIHGAVDDVFRMGTFEGKWKGTDAEKAFNKIANAVGDWTNSGALDPSSRLHTAEGLDALKQTLGEVQKRAKTDLSRAMATRARNAVRDTIVQQHPEYAGTMQAYSDASDAINEFEKTLSLGHGTTRDTAMRKLQSALRQNVYTNNGERMRLVDALAAHEPRLPASIAGRALSTWLPRGLARHTAGVAGGAGAAGVFAGMVNPWFLPLGLAASPRLRGEAVHGASRAVGAFAPIVPAVSPTYRGAFALDHARKDPRTGAFQ